MQAKLLETYGWQGQNYGPGEAEIPDGLAQALGLKTAGAADLADDKTLGEPDGVPDTATSTRSGKGKKPSNK